MIIMKGFLDRGKAKTKSAVEMAERHKNFEEQAQTGRQAGSQGQRDASFLSQMLEVGTSILAGILQAALQTDNKKALRSQTNAFMLGARFFSPLYRYVKKVEG